MTTLRRLLFCLFALVLLPGAQARASMPLQAGGVAVAGAMDAASGACHDALDSQSMKHVVAHRPEADAGPITADAASPMECCADHDGGTPGCGGACACPCPFPVASALIQAAIAGAIFLDDRTWQRPGHTARTGPPGGPPQRPPIG